MTAIIAVASGTAKTGKTVFSVNLAHYLCTRGAKTALLVAGSTGPVLGVPPDSTWPNVVNGRIPILNAVQTDVFGIDMVVTRGHGHALAGLTGRTADRMARCVGDLDSYAYLVVDMAAGITAPAAACSLTATEPILVVTAETAALTAAYDWLARMSRYGFRGPVNLVLNQVRKPALGQSIFFRFRDLAFRKLNIQVNFWGALCFDEESGGPDAHDRPITLSRPSSRLSRDIQAIGDRLLAEQPPENQTQPLRQFWNTFIDRLKTVPAMPARPVRVPASEAGVDPQPARIEQPAASAEMGDARNASTSTAAALDLVTEQLSTIAGELGAIRCLLEKTQPLEAADGQGPKEYDDAQTVLDFDAFAARQK